MGLLLLRVDAGVSYFTDLLPGLVVFGLGLSMTVAPLTATVLADADDSNAGIASGVNNAIARVAGLVAIAAVGAVVASVFGARLDDEVGPAALKRPAVAREVAEAKRQPLATVLVNGVPDELAASLRQSAEDASVHAFHVGLGIAIGLVALGGRARPRRDRQPAPPSGGRRLPGRPVRGPARGRDPPVARATGGSGAADGEAAGARAGLRRGRGASEPRPKAAIDGWPQSSLVDERRAYALFLPHSEPTPLSLLFAWAMRRRSRVHRGSSTGALSSASAPPARSGSPLPDAPGLPKRAARALRGAVRGPVLFPRHAGLR